jgi:phospho-N-acetylmuramoyl-pentapeptide-transferase
MLYYLAHYKSNFSPLNVFHYITFRSVFAFLTALGVSLWIAPFIIRKLRERKLAQSIRKDGPPQHQTKSGTPAMGGIIIYVAIVVSTLLWARLSERLVLLSLSVSTALFFIGLFDDGLKMISKKKEGISSSVKMAGQLIVALGVSSYLYLYPPQFLTATSISIPYAKDWLIHLGAFYIPFGMMVLVGCSNAVNLSDGLDGLASGSLVISGLTMALFAYLAGHGKFSTYLRIIPVQGAGELTVVLAAMVGACLGFLWFNAHPAEIFMGDTGSLFLGGLLGLVALCVKQELILAIVGGVFVIEALSVLAQVYSFRIHSKRIFKMAPLHHHFELLGWPESKVTIRFWIVSIILSLVALASLKLR